MFGFLAFIWLTSRDGWRERSSEDDSGVILALLLAPIVWTLLFGYLLYCGLEDVGAGRMIRWTATLLASVAVLAACLEGRWWIGLGMAFGIGLLGLLLVMVGAYLRAKLTPSETEDSSDASGPRWRFS